MNRPLLSADLSSAIIERDPLAVMRGFIAQAENAQRTSRETILEGGVGDDRYERAMDEIEDARRQFNAFAQILLGADLERIGRAFQ